MSGSSVLEVIACSVADAVEAMNGGAGRLEVVRDLKQGGLTPPFELVRDIKNAVDLPLRVMVRESNSYEVESEEEIEKLCTAADRFAALGVDGLVLGFLHHGKVDTALTDCVLRCAPNLRATFHHAFEDAQDQLEALNSIRLLPTIDRILSSGGRGDLVERVERLNNYQRVGDPEFTIIAGGGIDLDAISELRRTTLVREFHVGRAARLGNSITGAVSAEAVASLVRVVQSTLEKSNVGS